jgi:hypothetical protein
MPGETKAAETLNEITANSIKTEPSPDSQEDHSADWNQGGLGKSSIPDRPQIDPNDSNTFNTAEDASESTAVEEPAKKEGEPEGDEKGKEKDGGLDGQDDRFDKHPRWQEMSAKAKKADELEAKNAELMSELETLRTPTPAKEEEQPDYEDVTQLDDDEIIEKFNDDPKSFMANFAKQVRSEVVKSVFGKLETSSKEAKVRQRVDQFAKDNEDFLPKLKDGTIAKYMQANPGHTPISAYLEMTNADRQGSVQKQIDEAVKKAVKETEEKVRKDLLAKRRVVPIDSSAAPKDSANHDKELQDTKKLGGTVAAITQRILRQRQAS